MAAWLAKRRYGPIGIDLGSRSVKLMQFDADRARVLESVRWDLASGPDDEGDDREARVIDALRRAREGRAFRGREAVFGVGSQGLFVQNIRVPQGSGRELDRIVCAEAAGRLPFPGEEAEIRYLEAGNVRQGDALRREIIVLACRRDVLGRILSVAEASGLKPRAIDVEPSAMLRCYARQFRRDEDQQRRMLLANVGASRTTVVISRGHQPMFMKYIDVGGRHFDEAVARSLNMNRSEAAALRRHNGDRRADQRDPEIARSIAESLRSPLDQLANELTMCVRYDSVTFRGEPLERVILGGGEASETLAEWLAPRLNLPCELGDPLRDYERPMRPGRAGQWDVAAGLALREVN